MGALKDYMRDASQAKQSFMAPSNGSFGDAGIIGGGIKKKAPDLSTPSAPMPDGSGNTYGDHMSRILKKGPTRRDQTGYPGGDGSYRTKPTESFIGPQIGGNGLPGFIPQKPIGNMGDFKNQFPSLGDRWNPIGMPGDKGNTDYLWKRPELWNDPWTGPRPDGGQGPISAQERMGGMAGNMLPVIQQLMQKLMGNSGLMPMASPSNMGMNNMFGGAGNIMQRFIGQ